MENALSTLSTLPENKQQLTDFKANLKNAILSGVKDGLEIKKLHKVLEEILKTFKEPEVVEMIESEADKYHEKSFEYIGAKFQKRNNTKYDFSVCEDSELIQLEQQEKLVKTNLKARQDFLKGLKENYINQETGEVIKPPAKTTSEILAITLK
jgi:hypothetical protein